MLHAEPAPPSEPRPQRPPLHRQLSNAWTSTQVELHGQYSLARLEELHKYEQNTPRWRVLLVCLLTPALAVVLIILTDSIPLEAPTRGLSNSQMLWLRAFVTIVCIAGPTLLQLRFIIPNLRLSLLEVSVLTLLSSAAAVATQFALANLIGYPVPFGLVLGTPACFVVLVAGVAAPRRAELIRSMRLRQQLKDYVTVWVCQIGFTVIYPVYNYAFTQLSSHVQTVFVLLLPAIKIANKNWINYSLRDTDDLKPEVAVFNVEVFHALYVAVCMQSSTSLNTTLALMGIDVIQAWMSIREVNHILSEVQELMNKVPVKGRRVSSEMIVGPVLFQGVGPTRQRRNILDATVDALAEDAPLRRHSSFRRKCFADASSKSRRASTVASVPAMTPLGPSTNMLVPTHASTAKLTVSSRASSIQLFASKRIQNAPDAALGPADSILPNGKQAELVEPGLSAEERLKLVQKTLKLLFVTEFVVLVEYTEVVVPIIFNACVEGMIHLPNREYYLPLTGRTDAQLRRTTNNVAVYGTLEFLSFVAFGLLLRWKLRFSVLTQVAFVLEKQLVMVQSKLVMWTFYVLQTSLLHFGADFSFSFSWLSRGK